MVPGQKSSDNGWYTGLPKGCWCHGGGRSRHPVYGIVGIRIKLDDLVGCFHMVQIETILELLAYALDIFVTPLDVHLGHLVDGVPAVI